MQIPMPDKLFEEKLNKVIEVMRKEGISIAREDKNEPFVVENVDELNYLWLRKAHNQATVTELGGYTNSPETSKLASEASPNYENEPQPKEQPKPSDSKK